MPTWKPDAHRDATGHQRQPGSRREHGAAQIQSRLYQQARRKPWTRQFRTRAAKLPTNIWMNREESIMQAVDFNAWLSNAAPEKTQ